MKRLLREAFKRFAGQSPQGIFALRQAMGGGKTHNMIALGLLARNPHLRESVMGDLHQYPDLETVNVSDEAILYEMYLSGAFAREWSDVQTGGSERLEQLRAAALASPLAQAEAEILKQAKR